jgi:single-strand DNA-binding protein
VPINSVTIVGNLTRDPELRGLPSGGSVCSLRVAVNERRKNGDTGQWDDVPNFFNVTIFGNSADAAAKFLTKGRQVAVDGRLRWREFQDKDGNRREAIEIVAQNVQFIGGRDDQAPGQAAYGGQGGGFGQPSAPPPAQTGGFGAPAPAPSPGATATQERPTVVPAAQWPDQSQLTSADDDIPF